MRSRTALATSLVAVLAAGSLAPALAAPAKPKPVSKEYVAAAFPPDPSHAATGAGICNTVNPASQHNEPFTVPFKGTLVIDMKGFQGDWDLALYSGSQLVAESAQALEDDPQRPEKITVKLKKVGQKLTIRACNFAGGPTANLKYVHTAS
jgi:hypothetical protein